jgi:hypothetical protein
MTEPGSQPPPPPRLRPRWLYRAAYIWAGLGISWLLASGRLVSYFAAFRKPLQEPSADQTDLFATALLWLLFIAPLLLLAFELGMQHTEARRLNTGLWRGLRESWRVAWQRPHLDEMAVEFAEKPEDDVFMAVMYGVGIAAMPLVLFLGVIPGLRTVAGVIWVGGAGVLFGVSAYCHRRAAAYLRDDPGRWNMFRQWSLLNASRYEPAGRPFVRAQIVCAVLLPIWWLGGGVLVMSRGAGIMMTR